MGKEEGKITKAKVKQEVKEEAQRGATDVGPGVSPPLRPRSSASEHSSSASRSLHNRVYRKQPSLRGQSSQATAATATTPADDHKPNVMYAPDELMDDLKEIPIISDDDEWEEDWDSEEEEL